MTLMDLMGPLSPMFFEPTSHFQVTRTLERLLSVDPGRHDAGKALSRSIIAPLHFYKPSMAVYQQIVLSSGSSSGVRHICMLCKSMPVRRLSC